MELLRHGWLQSELRIATTLVPSPAVSGPQGTLPHHLSVHVYVTVSAVDDVIGLDLRFHNGHSGRDKETALIAMDRRLDRSSPPRCRRSSCCPW